MLNNSMHLAIIKKQVMWTSKKVQNFNNQSSLYWKCSCTDFDLIKEINSLPCTDFVASHV